jgi:hypothetical protein
MKTPAFFLASITLGLLITSCITSPNPFYTERDIFQDDRILGDYAEGNTEDCSAIRKDPDHSEHYILRYYRKQHPEKWIELAATLFRVGTNSYVDLFPVDESSFEHIPGVPPSGMDVIRNIMHQPLHALARISINDKGVALSFPQQRSLAKLVEQYPSFTNYVRQESMLLLPQSSNELHALLAKEGQSLFPDPTDFKKPKVPSK